MAEILAKQYGSVFSDPDVLITNMDITDLPNTKWHHMDEITITPERSSEAIGEIPNDAVPGPDSVVPYFLKKGGVFILDALEDILKSTMELGYLPQRLKDIWITPLWKGGPRTDPAEYRPLAMSSHITKTLERLIRKQMVEYMNDHNLLEKCQHGSTSGRSTLTQLISQHSSLIDQLKNGANVELMYLDFSKAFDKVSHPILLRRMASFGFKGPLLNWLKAFLSDRYQQVRVGQKLSTKTWVRSGVPQGSVLGPLFFLLFISNLGDELDENKENLLKYVDDAKFFGATVTNDDIENYQSNLNTIYDWANENDMVWNTVKFQLLRMGPNKDMIENTYIFSPNYGEVIPESDHVKDLGILVDSNLSYKVQ